MNSLKYIYTFFFLSSLFFSSCDYDLELFKEVPVDVTLSLNLNSKLPSGPGGKGLLSALEACKAPEKAFDLKYRVNYQLKEKYSENTEAVLSGEIKPASLFAESETIKKATISSGDYVLELIYIAEYRYGYCSADLDQGIDQTKFAKINAVKVLSLVSNEIKIREDSSVINIRTSSFDGNKANKSFDDDEDAISNLEEIGSFFKYDPLLISDPLLKDTDADGIEDKSDIIPNFKNDKADSDSDGDGIIDSEDNCPTKANKNQQNSDDDEKGNACDPDIDNDGFCNKGVSSWYCKNDTADEYKGLNDPDDDNDLVSNQKDCDTKDPEKQILVAGDTEECVKDDDDDDNDNYSDYIEKLAGTDPLNQSKHPGNMIDSVLADRDTTNENADFDGDFQINRFDADDDNDGILDTKDCAPTDEQFSISLEKADINGNTCVEDDNDWDNDGIFNTRDDHPKDPSQ